MKRLGWFTITNLTLIVLYVGFVVFFEGFSKRFSQKQINYEAHLLGHFVWNYNKEPVNIYSSEVAKVRGYTAFKITHRSGEVFVERYHNFDDSNLNHFFRSVGLIRSEEYASTISFSDQPIADYEITKTNYNIYVYLVVFAFFGLFFSIACLIKFLESSRIKRLRTERELSEESSRLHKIVSAAPVITFSSDLNGNIISTDGRGLKKIQLQRDEIVGEPVHDVFTGCDDFLRAYDMALEGKVVKGAFDIQDRVFDVWISPRHLDDDICGVMSVLTDVSRLKNALDEVADRQAVMQSELSLAKAIHRLLTPLDIPPLEGFEFGLLFEPCGGLGGDFVSFHPSESGLELEITLADITGHGVGAALLSTMYRVMLDDAILEPGDIKENLIAMNDKVHKKFPQGFFASTFYAKLNATTLEMTYLKAAQDPVYIFRNGVLHQTISEGAPALGLMPREYIEDDSFVVKQFTLSPGDLVFLFTDGLIEMENAEGVEIGREKLVQWIEEDIGLPPQELVDKIYQRAGEHLADDLPIDDVTALAVKVKN